MTFQYVKPNDEQKVLMQHFRDEFETLANKIYEKVETSRGKSKAISRLEEASFWLNKAITEND